MFYGLPRCQCYKTFFLRHCRQGQISQSVCIGNHFPVQSNICQKHQELTQEGSILQVLQLGWLQPCPQILRPDWKRFPRTNALAYQASSSATKEKSFITLTPDYLSLAPWAERHHLGPTLSVRPMSQSLAFLRQQIAQCQCTLVPE